MCRLKIDAGIPSVSVVQDAKNLWLEKDLSLMDPIVFVLSAQKLNYSKNQTWIIHGVFEDEVLDYYSVLMMMQKLPLSYSTSMTCLKTDGYEGVNSFYCFIYCLHPDVVLFVQCLSFFFFPNLP